MPEAPSPDWAALRAALLAWFEVNARAMPARETHDPWRLLVLEVMSQQTQIARAAPASEAFCERFPTPAALAAAGAAEAVRAWSGLGYNRRAVALWRAAVEIVERHSGVVPGEVAALDALPGVGPYTARAVAAHAFGVPVAPVDVNVSRVVGRLVRGAEPGRLQLAADALLDPADPSRSIHALMDLSAAVCRRRSPDCASCPLAFGCASAFAASDIRRPSQPRQPFPASTRWLRGALLRELVSAANGTWSGFDDRSVGDHGPDSVRQALAALASDGLIELDGPSRARLAQPDAPNGR